MILTKVVEHLWIMWDGWPQIWPQRSLEVTIEVYQLKPLSLKVVLGGLLARCWNNPKLLEIHFYYYNTSKKSKFGLEVVEKSVWNSELNLKTKNQFLWGKFPEKVIFRLQIDFKISNRLFDHFQAKFRFFAWVLIVKMNFQQLWIVLGTC